MNRRILQIGNLVGFILTIILNGLANALPINNMTTGELSDNIPNLFVPAGLTFSIWGVIYLFLAIFIIVQLKGVIGEADDEVAFVDEIGVFFIISSLGNSLWILAWHYEQIALSLVLMFVILGSLLAIYLRLGIGTDKDISDKRRIAVNWTFSIYLGWITVATIANVTALAVTSGWGAWGISEELWTALVIIVAGVITLAMIFTRDDFAYSFVIVWALAGIIIKRVDPALTFYPLVVYTAAAVLGIIVIGMLFRFLQLKKDE